MKPRLVAFLRDYGGFLLGVPLVPILLLWPPDFFDEFYQGLSHMLSHLDDRWYSVAFYLFLHNALSALHVFGFSFLLGGLLSHLKLTDGIVVTMTLTLGWVLVFSLALGPFQSSEEWHFLPALVAVLTTTLICYLFGYSLRRLIFLSGKAHP